MIDKSDDMKKPKTILMTLDLFDSGLALLCELRKVYSTCFFEAGKEKPLKKGIVLDLYAAGCDFDSPSDQVITVAIKIYTSSLTYRTSLIREGSTRVDLQGNVTEAVTDRERVHAKSQSIFLNWKILKEEWPVVEAIRNDNKVNQARRSQSKSKDKTNLNIPTIEANIATKVIDKIAKESPHIIYKNKKRMLIK